MRYSTFATSLLVSSAAAWRLPAHAFQLSHGFRPTGFPGIPSGGYHVPTGNAPSGSAAPTGVAPTASAAPVPTFVFPSSYGAAIPSSVVVSSVAASSVVVVPTSTVTATAEAAPTKYSTRKTSTKVSTKSSTKVSTATSTQSSTKTSAVATATATPGSGTLTTDEQAALDAHNNARAEVGTVDLTWDTALAADALAYAKTLAASGTFEHSGVSGQGENLYMQTNSDNPLVNAVNAFNDEKSAYNGEPIDESNYSHYTQVVWKDTTKVGMASAVGASGTYVVARYQAPGNYIGETAY